MIIRLIRRGTNYTHTATAHPCCQHVGSGSAVEPGKAMGVGGMGIPSSNVQDLQGYCTSSCFGIHQSAGMACGPFEARDLPLHLGIFWVSREILGTYTNTIFVYIIYKISTKIDSWTDSLKVHILPDQPFIQKHEVCFFVWLKYIPALGKDHEDFLRKLGQLP